MVKTPPRRPRTPRKADDAGTRREDPPRQAEPDSETDPMQDRVADLGRRLVMLRQLVASLRAQLADRDSTVDSLRVEILSLRLRNAALNGQLQARPDAQLEASIRAWFRDLSLRFHPDRLGGSTQAMVVVNEAHDRLRKLLNLL